jgi:excinuclease UvrABC ATPase subunit
MSTRVKPALFSANSEGACPTCNGNGVIHTELGVMETVATTCEDCGGKRFQASVPGYHLGGRDISEVLAMSVTEAQGFFGVGEARPRPPGRSSIASPRSGSATSPSL